MSGGFRIVSDTIVFTDVLFILAVMQEVTVACLFIF